MMMNVVSVFENFSHHLHKKYSELRRGPNFEKINTLFDWKAGGSRINVRLSSPGTETLVAETAINNGRKGREEPDATSDFCSLCLETFETNPEVLCTIQCSHHHLFCYPCLMRFVKFCCTASEDTSAHIPACPKANEKDGGCNYVMKQMEVERIFEMGMALPVEDHGMEWSDCEKVMKKLSKMYLVMALKAMSCVRCPTCPGDESDGYWISLSDYQPRTTIAATRGSNVPFRVNCSRCKNSFCSCCFVVPFHHNCTCEEYVRYAQDWAEWLGGKQAEYLQEMAVKDEKYQAELNKHEKELAVVKARYNEVSSSEATLAGSCRTCPHCGIVIIKISGCDSMSCGNDMYGNSTRVVGCGASFNWSSAKSYVPRHVQLKIASCPPQNNKLKHIRLNGTPLLCNRCNQRIEGPCIQCLHCAFYYLCITCNLALVCGSNDETVIDPPISTEKEEEKVLIPSNNNSKEMSVSSTHTSTHTCRVLLKGGFLYP